MKAKKSQERRGVAPRSATVADGSFDPVARKFINDPHVARTKMFGSEGLKVGGKVFVMLVKGRLVAKLPRERVEALVASRDGEFFDPGHGRLMKEWVAVKAGNGDWLSLARDARDFVAKGQ